MNFDHIKKALDEGDKRAIAEGRPTFGQEFAKVLSERRHPHLLAYIQRAEREKAWPAWRRAVVGWWRRVDGLEIARTLLLALLSAAAGALIGVQVYDALHK